MGTECSVFNGTNGFLKHISEHKNSVLRLRVYNSGLCEVREVKVKSMETNLVGGEFGCGPDHKMPELLGGTVVQVRKSVAVEISKGSIGIIAAAVGISPKNSKDPILMSDMDITLGEPITSLYEEIGEKYRNIIPKNTQATSAAEFDE